ncbi:hypothetical protein [Hoeflea sp.]|uniref:hypothetical protein n=1 Tax=Hoeflea sp. TaxID=1940281 RepID=UPI0019C0526B|nr:hypothetical protein [Hoeflea sp.]MBC7285578.1 hypothetical protein [Hoeflea sp.]
MAQTSALEQSSTFTPFVLCLREELQRGFMKRLDRFLVGDLEAEVCQGRDSVWCLIRRKGRGGLALRAAYVNGAGFTCREVPAEPGEVLQLEIDSVLGKHRLCFSTSGADLHRLRAVTHFIPSAPMHIPFVPRDLYVLGKDDDPTKAQGNVEAAQRGVNGGLVYFRFSEPDFGSVLYFQNLTALNDYFRASRTKPDGVVGGHWPELGLQLPTPQTQEVQEQRELKAGEELVLSDAIVVFRDWAGDNEQEMARQFLQMLGVAYKTIEPPAVEYHDWVQRAELTLKHLESAPQATERHFGDLYVMPYVEGEVPDVMVQLSVINSLCEYGMWRGEPVPLEAELWKGMERFYDPKLKMLRRFLPDVGDAKDPDAVDSWYYYHPLLNLGRLALRGHKDAKTLLFKSVEYGIRAAQHFDYAWPVMYKAQDFSIIQKARGDERFGQTDVGGIYAYVMLQCFELTGEDRFIQEARRAIDKGRGLRFDLLYQTNLTVWGAVACMRLWRITEDADYLAQSYANLAGFFHTIPSCGNRRSAPRGTTRPSWARPACTTRPTWRCTSASRASPGSRNTSPRPAPISSRRRGCCAATSASSRSAWPGSTFPTPSRRRSCTGASIRAGPSTASSPSRWRTSMPTGRRRGRSGRKSMAAAGRSSSPHAPTTRWRMRASGCSATASSAATNGPESAP